MTWMIQTFLIGLGLAMDAFAVAICKGLGMSKLNKKQAIIISIYFGGFQALMPLIGWLLGVGFQQYIVSIDHWIAFVLLGFIGGKMIYEAIKGDDEDAIEIKDAPLNHKELVLLAIATSIDALAVGVTFAFLEVPIVESIVMIGVTTFIICIIGVVIGNFFGSRLKKKAEFAGGLILILIGLKILLEHLGIIGF